MMKIIMMTLTVAFLNISSAVADDLPPTTLWVKNPYALATTSVQKNGAVFMVIKNTGEMDESIIKAESDVAERIELHTHIMDGDMMMMREVGAYDIPAGDSVKLEPMGHHIMLMGIKEPLKAGESFVMTLTTDEDAKIAFEVTVKTPAQAAEDRAGDIE